MGASTGNSRPPFFGDVITLMAMIAMRVDWKKIGSRNLIDVWNHRIGAATSCRDMAEFCSKLCNYFGLQSIQQDALPLIERLDEDRDAVLDYIRSRHIQVGTLSFCERKKLWRKSESTESSDS